MASAVARAKLARAARRLNQGAGLRTRLPPLIFLSDELRVRDPVGAAQSLPRGTAVILRHRDPALRAELASGLARVAHARGLVLLIAGDPELVARVGAAGQHLSQARISEARHWRGRHPAWLITCAAHSERAVLHAARGGADAVLLAPVFPTRSHPDAPAIGLLRACGIAGRAPLPVYALGGVGERTAVRLSGARFSGLAAIAALLPG